MNLSRILSCSVSLICWITHHQIYARDHGNTVCFPCQSKKALGKGEPMSFNEVIPPLAFLTHETGREESAETFQPRT